MLGVIKDLPNEQYHASEGVSRSGLMKFRMCPEIYWNHYLNEKRPIVEATEAMNFGSAFHTMLLEPELFEKEYIVDNIPLPELDDFPLLKDLKAEFGDASGKEMFEANKEIKFRQEQNRIFAKNLFESSSRGKIVLSKKHHEILIAMKESVERHPQASDLIKGAVYENSIFWRDPHTDVLCKTRPDIWHDDMTVDLKTAASADERSFISSMVKYGYHMQSAMNFEGILHATGKAVKNHAFIVVEKTFPFCVAVYILDETALETARSIFKNTLIKFKASKENGEWQGYKTTTVSLPSWVEKF